MTFGYSATLSGMRGQIIEAYQEIAGDAPMPSAYYLAKKVRGAAERLLKRPAQVMECIRQLAGCLADNGKILEWTTPTGFPVSNDYREPGTKVIALPVGAGRRVWCTIAVGTLPKIQRGKARNAAPPNYVHSMDATHLVRVVNRAFAEGITNLVTVHDCYACLAPQAKQLRRIIREEMASLYAADHLADLVGHNLPNVRVRDRSRVKLPDYGSLDPSQVINAEYFVS